jgi:heme/copper-type cytochrome/quinol oxidase subunit 2
MYGGETSSMWSDYSLNTILFIIFIVVVSIISIICGGFLIDFYYKNIDNSDYNDLKDDIKTLYYYAIGLIVIPIITLIFIIMGIIFVKSLFFIAGFFCLVNCFLGAGTLSQNFHVTTKINNKKIILIK